MSVKNDIKNYLYKMQAREYKNWKYGSYLKTDRLKVVGDKRTNNIRI